MTEPEELDEDLFADLYDAEETATKPPLEESLPPADEPISTANGDALETQKQPPDIPPSVENGRNTAQNGHFDADYGNSDMYEAQVNDYPHGDMDTEHRNVGIKEDGKMFIGGLNWETDDESLKNYFSSFGEVLECTVMRDGASGRSRGFGFLTFKDPKVVNVVMVKEHFLDGKIIDPKRAIPREEQERTAKIFVGGVSQDANDAIFREYFMQFGRVVDATLMIDKETGRPRGFGFVTFDSDQAVDNALNGDLKILGKPIDIKRAQPRGNMREDEDFGSRRGRGGRGGFRNDRDNYDNNANNINGQMQQQMQGGQGGGGQGMYPNGMTPSMMAQYFQKMQQYVMTMNQQMAAMQGGAMGAMNPMMMMQMQQRMQQMQQQQQQLQNQGNNNQQQQNGSASPDGSGNDNQQNQMNPAMLQQMQQMQQMQQQMAAAQQQQANGSQSGSVPPAIANPFPPPTGPSGGQGTPGGLNPQEQMAFEQQKYERQAQQAAMFQGGQAGWEGMYDDVPPPQQQQQQQQQQHGGGGYGGHHGGGYYRGGRGRGGYRGGYQNRQYQQQNQNQQQQQQHAGGSGGGGGGSGNSDGGQAGGTPPPNAPTGPKNPGRPTGNYRGGGRGGHRGFHPYARG